MKKLMILLMLVLVISNTFGQKRYDLTFIASPQVSWMTSDAKHLRNGMGFLGFGYGVEGDIFLNSDKYMIVTGMTISTVGGSLVHKKSMQVGGTVFPVGTSVEYNLTNLEFPFALKMRTRNFDRFSYFAQFGLTNWLNIKTRVTSNDDAFQIAADRHKVRLLTIGLNIGAGLEYELGRGNALTAGLIYSDGFSDLTNNPGANENTSLNILRFRLGFIF